MAPSRKAEYETTCPRCGHVFDVAEDPEVACPECATRIRLTEEPQPPVRHPGLAILLGALTPVVCFGLAYLLLSEWFHEWERTSPVDEWMLGTAAVVVGAIGIAAGLWNRFDRDGWRVAFGLFLIGPILLLLLSLWESFGELVARFVPVVAFGAAVLFAIGSVVLWSRKRSDSVASRVQRYGVAAVIAAAVTALLAYGLLLLVAASFP